MSFKMWDESPAVPCPLCQKMLDHTLMINDTSVPGPGAWTVCADCGGILRFTSGMTLRIATRSEMVDLGAWRLESLFRFRDKLMQRKAARN